VRAENRQASREFPVGGDGRFLAEQLEPATYMVYAHAADGDRTLRSAIEEIELNETAVNNLALTLTTPFTITGTIEPAAGVSSVRMEPTTDRIGAFILGVDRTHGAPMQRDGTFEIRGVEPDRFRIVLQPASDDRYIKGLALDGTAMTGGILDLRSGAGARSVKIVLGRAASLSGVVEGTHAMAAVVLNPDGKESWDDVQEVRADSDGNYSFHGLAPGKYRVVAIDAFESGAAETDKPKDFASLAETIEIKEGDRALKNLKIAVKGSGNAKK
jgi:hypothetical protein